MKDRFAPTNPETIDEYIKPCSPEVRAILAKIRSTIRRVSPDAEAALASALGGQGSKLLGGRSDE